MCICASAFVYVYLCMCICMFGWWDQSSMGGSPRLAVDLSGFDLAAQLPSYRIPSHINTTQLFVIKSFNIVRSYVIIYSTKAHPQSHTQFNYPITISPLTSTPPNGSSYDIGVIQGTLFIPVHAYFKPKFSWCNCSHLILKPTQTQPNYPVTASPLTSHTASPTLDLITQSPHPLISSNHSISII